MFTSIEGKTIRKKVPRGELLEAPGRGHCWPRRRQQRSAKAIDTGRSWGGNPRQMTNQVPHCRLGGQQVTRLSLHSQQ